MHQELGEKRLREAELFTLYFLLKHAEELKGIPIVDRLRQVWGDEIEIGDGRAFLEILIKRGGKL